jgi:hypothetical protein
MKYFIDTEFHEYKKRTKVLGIPFGKGIDTIDLISIGIVNEDNETYYALCSEFDVDDAWDNDWLRVNVLKSIWEDFKGYYYGDASEFNKVNLKKIVKFNGLTKDRIAKDLLYFCSGDYFNGTGLDLKQAKNYTIPEQFRPSFYGYYCDYDWVVFCWLFGRMIDLPKGFPMYCRDIKQYADTYNVRFPNQAEGKHNALADARHIKACYYELGLHGIEK